MKQNDLNFICSTWLRGLYYGNSWFREIDKDLFMENYNKVVHSILSKENVEARISCLKEDPDTILGYAILEPQRNAIHWLYTKDAWRKLGIAKHLLGNKEKWQTVTHLTELGKSIKPKHYKFNPFFT